jgi:hypothetical protein
MPRNLIKSLKIVWGRVSYSFNGLEMTDQCQAYEWYKNDGSFGQLLTLCPATFPNLSFIDF